MDEKPPYPEDTKLFIFDWALRCIRALVPKSVQNFSKFYLLGVSHHVPVTLVDLPQNAKPLRAFRTGVALGWLFCLGGVTFMTYLAGTLTGSDPNRVYFSKDLPNIINYVLLAPLYIGLAAAFIVLVLLSCARLSRSPILSTLEGKEPQRIGMAAMLVAV